MTHVLIRAIDIHPRATCALYLKSSLEYFQPVGLPEPGVLMSISRRPAESFLFPERMVLLNARFLRLKTCISTPRIPLKVPRIWMSASQKFVELICAQSRSF